MPLKQLEDAAKDLLRIASHQVVLESFSSLCSTVRDQLQGIPLDCVGEGMFCKMYPTTSSSLELNKSKPPLVHLNQAPANASVIMFTPSTATLWYLEEYTFSLVVEQACLLMKKAYPANQAFWVNLIQPVGLI